MKFKSEIIQSAYDKMETLFSKFAETPEVIKATFTDAKLEDGVTVIQYEGDMPMQGQPVMVVTEEGILPMPDGEYKLEDGSIMTCSGGLVASYTPVEEATPEGEVTNEPATVPATPNAASMEQSTPKRVIKSQVEEHVFTLEIEGVEPIVVDFSSMFSKLIEENKALKEMNKEMFNVINEIAGEPATAPTERATTFNRNDELKKVKEAFKILTAKPKK